MRAGEFTLGLLLLLLLGATESCSRRSSDKKIANDIRQQVATDPETSHSKVQVTVKSGKVTLTGEVDTPLAQQQVEQIAQKEPGVTAVDDEAMVEPPSALSRLGERVAVEEGCGGASFRLPAFNVRMFE